MKIVPFKFNPATADHADLDAYADMDPDLARMNAEYAVVRIGGKTRVVAMEESPTYPGSAIPVFSTIPDFIAFHAKHKKEVEIDGKTKRIGIGKWWIEHEGRRQYDGIVYAPNESPPGKLNLWTGYGCQAVKGDCNLYLEHIQENVCGGNSDYSNYLIGWMAFAAQYPARQGEVAVVLRGKEGTGKGMFAKWFGRLFGPHFKHILNAKHLVGHFNAHLQHCSVLYADEAFFAGDRSHESVLKGLITEETLLIEPKGVDSYSVRNCIHLIMSSNSEWVVPAGADARRYFVLDVSDQHMQDDRYFGALEDQMKSGGQEALLHFLLHEVTLDDFNLRSVPQTSALADQKTRTRKGVDRLIEHLAHRGILPNAEVVDHPNIAVTSGEDRGRGFYCSSRAIVPDLKHDSHIVIAKTLKKQWGCGDWHSGGRRGIKFPPLNEVRALFDRRHGPQEWDASIENWETEPTESKPWS
jgi:hypothetical protein